MRVLAFLVLLVLCTGYALARGGAPERAVAAAMLAAVAADLVGHSIHGEVFDRVDYVVFAIDLALLGVIGIVAMHANRYWPLWLASIQAIAVLMHLGRALSLEIGMQAYGLVTAAGGYVMVTALAVGTWRHRQRLRSGEDPGWTSPFPIRFG